MLTLQTWATRLRRHLGYPPTAQAYAVTGAGVPPGFEVLSRKRGKGRARSAVFSPSNFSSITATLLRFLTCTTIRAGSGGSLTVMGETLSSSVTAFSARARIASTPDSAIPSARRSLGTLSTLREGPSTSWSKILTSSKSSALCSETPSSWPITSCFDPAASGCFI